MFSNNDRFYGLNMITRASCVLDATDHHAKMVMAWETTSTRRDSSCTSSHQILFTKFWTRSQIWDVKRLSSNNGTGPEEDQTIWEKAKLRQQVDLIDMKSFHGLKSIA